MDHLRKEAVRELSRDAEISKNRRRMRYILGSIRFAAMTNESCVFGHDEQREDLQ